MSFSLSNNNAYFIFKNHSFVLMNTGKNVWRLISERGGAFNLIGAAQTLADDLGESCETTAQTLTLSDNRVLAEDGSYVTVNENEIGFYDCDGKAIRKVRDVYDKDDSICIELVLNKSERLFGTGERFNRVNQRGKRIHIFAIDKWCRKEGNSYIPIPLIISSDGGAVFFNRYEHSVMDLGRKKADRITVSQKYANLDMYIFTADNPADILKDYSEITGFAPMPSDWAFGTLVCRYHPDFSTKDGVLQMADAMEKNGFPWEAVIMEGWGTYDNHRWNELKELSEILHSMGKKMMVYEPCGKFPLTADKLGLDDSFAVNSAKGTYLKQTRSMNLLDNFHRKNMRCIDITSKTALKKWEEIWDKLLNYVGVDGAKIDFCEQFPDSEDIQFADSRNPRAAHHWYPTYYNVLRYRHFATHPDGGLNFSRGGGIGAQRYPFVWAGDQRREFNFLRSVVKAALSLGLSGVPFVSWDMAGYRPAYLLIDRLKEKDVFIRGLEFTAFAPNIQTHGSVKRPYDFDEHTKSVYRAYTMLHEALRPYLKQQAEISCRTGMPMMRHLFLYDCEDKKVLDIEDEYMLGECLLIAPILRNSRRRDIYLPKGEWKNIFTGECFKGGQTIRNVHVPLEMIPVFKKTDIENAILDESLKNAQQYIDEISEFKGTD
ncbi:MAG: hypothetical protein MJ168_10500 [Clostridia bacterium]|nr:hypothetical protein [Clostridia bacterium]